MATEKEKIIKEWLWGEIGKLENNDEKLKKENEKLKEENEKLKELLKDEEDFVKEIKEKREVIKKENKKLKKEIMELKEVNEKKYNKVATDLQIANQFIYNYVDKDIMKCIDEGINQYTFILENKEMAYHPYQLEYLKKTNIPMFITHTGGDKDYNPFKNGYYYHKNDCYSQYELDDDGEGTYYFSRVDTDEEDEVDNK